MPTLDHDAAAVGSAAHTWSGHRSPFIRLPPEPAFANAQTRLREKRMLCAARQAEAAHPAARTCAQSLAAAVPAKKKGNDMNIDVTEFRLHEGDEVDLGLWTTDVKALCKSKKAYRKVLQDQVEQLSDLQRMLYALVDEDEAMASELGRRCLITDQCHVALVSRRKHAALAEQEHARCWHATL